MFSDMAFDINAYLSDSIVRFQIQQIGYLPVSQVSYVVLEDGQIFYGMPEEKGTISEKIIIGAGSLIKELEFRYFQIGRRYTQHSKYQYKPGDVVVELGAYLGFYSMYAAKQVGPTGRVISVEMIPNNYAILKKNLSTNYPQSTVAINCGIHRRKGVGTAYLGRNQIAGFRKDVVARFSKTMREIKVKMETVDHLLEENAVTHVDLMIIQVNGNEIDAFEGMQHAISMTENFSIAAPYNSPGSDHQKEIGAYLHTNGFDVELKSGWIFANRR